MNIIKNLIDFCNISYSNMFILLAVGIVFKVLSAVYDSVESNGVELIVAIMSKGGCFICTVVSCCALLLNGKNLCINSYNNYKYTCEVKSYQLMGGDKGIGAMADALKEAGIESTDIEGITDIDGMTEFAKKTAVELSSKEIALLADAK